MQTWKTRFRRIAAMVCALALCASLLPAGALANNTDGIDVDESSSSQVVTGTEPTSDETLTEETTDGQSTEPAKAARGVVVGGKTVNSTNEIFSVEYYEGLETDLRSNLTVIAVDQDNQEIDRAEIGAAYRAGWTMTITLNDAYKTAYELVDVTGADEVNVSDWSGDFNDAQSSTFTWSDNGDNATIYLHIAEASHVIELKNDTVDLGTITWKEGGKQLTTVEAYLNYELVYTSEPLNISNALNNFALDVNDGYYFDTVNMQDIKYSSNIDGQTFTYNSLGDYNKLVFGMVPSLFSGNNTIKLYFFNYENGIKTDFTRAINENLAAVNADAACDTLNISFSYADKEYSFPYTDFSQTGAVYLPKDTYVTVEPVIKDGYHFEYWRSGDAWTEGNNLYTIKSDGSWTSEITGTAGLQDGRIAFSETMGLRYSAAGFNRAQIILLMTDGGLIEDPDTNPNKKITYDPNYEGGPDAYVQYYYYTTGAMILDNMFEREGYEFQGWNTAKDGSGTPYAADTIYEYDEISNLILYAQWEKVGTGEPEIPPLDEETLEELFDGKVKVECTTVNNHGYIMTGLLGNKAEQGNDYWVEEGTEGHATVHIANSTLYVEEYERQKDNGDHFYLADGSNVDIGLTYDKEANAWKIDADDEPYIKLTCNPGTTPTTPEKPGYAVISDLLEVRVTCLSGSIHDAEDYPVIPATGYVVGEVVANGDGTYSCEVTIPSTPYIEKYSEDTKLTHTGTTDKETRTLVATLEGNTWTWTLPNTGASSTVEFLTTCKPDEPTTDVVDTLDIDVNVYCKDNVHSDATYDLMDGYDIGDVTYNTSTGAYESRLTIHGTPYLTAYNESVASGHTLFGDNEQYYTLTWDGTSWVKASTNPELYFQVTCKPDAPTPDDVDKLKIKDAVTLDCINTSVNHADVTYDLLKDSIITIGEVYGGTGGESYKVNLTIGPAYYVREYDMSMGTTHTWNGSDTGTITLSWDAVNNTWTAEAFDPIVFQVKCSTVTVPGDGGNNNDTPKDEHPDIAEGIANGTWGGTPTPTPAASATSTIPQTSDSMPIGLLAGTAAIAAAAIALLLVLRKRRQQ